MNTFLETLLSQSLFQNILLLLLTAALTGLLVPIIKAKIDNKDSQRRIIFEGRLDRQKKLSDYQTKLLDDLGDFLWEYQALALEVSYYKIRGNEKGYEKAFEQYDQKSPTLFHEIRAQVSKARRFANPESYEMCEKLYDPGMIDLDEWLIDLAEKGSSPRGDWNANHKFCFEQFRIDIDEALYHLARDFGFVEKVD